jgi:hypothetical protein
MSWISDDIMKAIEAYNRLPRCYRHQKLCPSGGCDCERAIAESLQDAPGQAAEPEVTGK